MYAPLRDLGRWRWEPPIILALVVLAGVLANLNGA